MSEWSCEAYGPDGAEFGAVCFVAPPGSRTCQSRDECRAVMAAERQRVFRAINERAAAGDLPFVDLADTFSRPDQLLGGDEGGVR